MADSREQICLWIYRHLFSRAHYWQLRDYAARGVIAQFAIGAMLMVMSLPTVTSRAHILIPQLHPRSGCAAKSPRRMCRYWMGQVAGGLTAAFLAFS